MAKRNVEKMDKSELRAACKAAGISYGKMTVQGMRDALTIRAAVKAVDAAAPAKAAEPVVTTAPQVAQVEAAPVAEATPAPAVAPAKAKKDAAPRIVQNGVKRPLEGGLCAAVWADLDKLHATGTAPTSQQVRDLATARGFNENNALCELSAWRKFMGLSKPRDMKPKRKTVAKTAAAAVRVDGEVDQQTA